MIVAKVGPYGISTREAYRFRDCCYSPKDPDVRPLIYSVFSDIVIVKQLFLTDRGCVVVPWANGVSYLADVIALFCARHCSPDAL